MEASADPNATVKAALPIPKSGKFGATDDPSSAHVDESGGPISPSGTAAPAPPVNAPDSKASSAATLAAAALAGDQVTPGYTPASYSDYAPPGYSSRDSVWPNTPSPSRDARPATAGFPPADGDGSRLSAGYVPVDPAAPPASPSSSRPSSIWTSQEPTSGKIGYSPSGSQRPDGVGLSTATPSPAVGAAAVSAAAGAAAAGIAATSQFPGRMVSSKTPAPTAPPTPTDDLVSKLKAPFSTVTKKRKPAQPPRQPNTGTGNASITAAVKTKPAPTKRPAASVTPQAARQPGAESRRDAQLVLSRVEPWSVMKFSFIVSLVGWVVLVVGVALIYYALRTFGVFHYLEQTVHTVTSSKGQAGENAASWFSASTVLGFTMLAGAINIVMFTALATLGAVIYNLVTHVAGGVEVTLREAD